MYYGVVGLDCKLKYLILIELLGLCLLYDMVFMKNYLILVDLLFFWQEDLLKVGFYVLMFYDQLLMCFVIVLCYGQVSEVCWFEVVLMFVLYWMNVYEEGNEIVFDGYFQENLDFMFFEVLGCDVKMVKIMVGIDEQLFWLKLYCWCFNLVIGKMVEE